MPEAKEKRRASIERSVAGYIAAGGPDEEAIRLVLEAAHEEESICVGDEVVCPHGGLIGVVLSINGPDAVIAWGCRGKSVEHLVDLSHVDHTN